MTIPVMIYIPEIKLFLEIDEGTGDNLLKEDIAEGYVDYIYYTTYSYEWGGLVEEEGGQIMLTQNFGELYNNDNVPQLIKDVMEFEFGRTYGTYVVIEPKGE